MVFLLQDINVHFVIILITYSCQWVGWHKECRGKLEQSRSSQHLAQPSSNILNQDILIVVMKKVFKKHYLHGGNYWAASELLPKKIYCQKCPGVNLC